MKENKNQSVVVENAGSDDTEIDLVELFYVFLNRIWLLVMCLVIGGAAAFAWTACFIKPVYKTSAELYVVSASNNSVVNLADLQLGSAVKTDYMELMLSRPVLEKVIENLNLNKSVKQLQKMISITNKSDTRHSPDYHHQHRPPACHRCGKRAGNPSYFDAAGNHGE